MFLELRLNCARVEHRIAQALEAGRLQMVKQLAVAPSNAQEYNLAAKAEDGGEREKGTSASRSFTSRLRHVWQREGDRPRGLVLDIQTLILG